MPLMHFEMAGHRLLADLADPLPIAIPLDFDGPQPAAFGAEPARARVVRGNGFVGDTREGGSCNHEQLTLTPHGNGTHTECVGHLTDERISVSETVRGGLYLALLVSVHPVAASATSEASHPAPAAADRVITAVALQAAAARHPAINAQALVLRTLPCGLERLSHAYEGPAPAPYLTLQATAWLVERGIEHLVLDLPSADRVADGGHLAAHRLFFGLPPGSRRASEATRAQASITELAYIAPTIRDGLYLLDLQLPAFLSDAAPSRPVLFPVRFA
jgi:arylformamidase